MRKPFCRINKGVLKFRFNQFEDMKATEAFVDLAKTASLKGPKIRENRVVRSPHLEDGRTLVPCSVAAVPRIYGQPRPEHLYLRSGRRVHISYFHSAL